MKKINNQVRIKRLQEYLGTDEADLNRLERLHKRKQKKIRRQMENEEIQRKKEKVEPLLISNESRKINVAVGTNMRNTLPIDEELEESEEQEESVEKKLEMLHRDKVFEQQEDLRTKKRELKHFYGSNAFKLMKDLSNHVVKKYAHLNNDSSEIPHFPWIREYNRFMAD